MLLDLKKLNSPMNLLKLVDAQKYLICASAIITAYLAPLFILWDNAPVLVHDNLDSMVMYSKVLAESGQLFGSINATVPQIMNGIPRNVMGSEFNAIQWLYVLFDPYMAYVLNLTIMHITAFIGMYLLLSRHFLDKNKDAIISYGAALSFSLLPFWPAGGLSISGMPLLLYAFLNIRKNKFNKIDWLVVSLFPFYSSFAWAGFFIIISLGIFCFIDCFLARKLNSPFIISIILVFFMYCSVEYRLIYSTFFDASYISHRVEFGIFENNDLGALKSSFLLFERGQYHAASLQQEYIGLAVALAFLILVIKTARVDYFGILAGIAAIIAIYFFFLHPGDAALIRSHIIVGRTLQLPVAIAFFILLAKRARYDHFVILVGIAALIALFYGFWRGDEAALIRSQFSIARTFQFDRFYWFYPLLWYMIFGLALKIICDNIKYGKIIALVFIVLQINFLFSLSDDSYQLGGSGINLSDQLSFNEFYSVDLFEKIKNKIGEDPRDYRIVSIGIHPAVSLFNGFYALDSYQNNYPLKYKHEFRRIMQDELGRNSYYQQYFDKWGSRCSIYAGELASNFMNLKDSYSAVNNLNINTKILYNMGGRYVISAVDIRNADAINLKLIDVFEDSKSPWRIRLYSIQDSFSENETMITE